MPLTRRSLAIVEIVRLLLVAIEASHPAASFPLMRAMMPIAAVSIIAIGAAAAAAAKAKAKAAAVALPSQGSLLLTPYDDSWWW